MKKSKFKYGLISLALLVGLPVNSMATELEKEPSQRQISRPENENPSDTDKPIENIDLEPTDSANEDKPEETNNLVELDLSDQHTAPRSLPQNIPTIIKKTPINPLSLLRVDTNKLEARALGQADLKLIDNGSEKYYELNPMLLVKGNGQEKEYIISVFALKDSEIKNISLDNVIAGQKVKNIKDLADDYKKLETDDISGFKFKVKIKNDANIKTLIKLDKDAKPGDYTIYYSVSSNDENILGSLETKLIKDSQDKLQVEKESKDLLDSLVTSKTNPFKDEIVTKYLANITDRELNITDYFDLSDPNSQAYESLVTEINPNLEDIKPELLSNPLTYKLAPKSLVKVQIGKKEQINKLLNDKLIKNEDILGAEKTQQPSQSLKTGTNLIDMLKLENKEKSKSDELVSHLKEKLAEAEKRMVENPKSPLHLEGPSQREVDNLVYRIDTTDKQIRDLIELALKNYQLQKLEDFKKQNLQATDKQYQQLKLLLDKADAKSKELEKKLIELKDIKTKESPDGKILTEAGKINLSGLIDMDKLSSLYKSSANESSKNITNPTTKDEVETVTVDESIDKKQAEKQKNNINYEINQPGNTEKPVDYLKGLNLRADLLENKNK